jgi:hypothetical protein
MPSNISRRYGSTSSPRTALVVFPRILSVLTDLDFVVPLYLYEIHSSSIQKDDVGTPRKDNAKP